MSINARILVPMAAALLSSCTAAPVQGQQACAPTAPDALGPYFVADMPVADDLNRHGKSGDPLTLAGRILSSIDGEPVPEARIEIWQTDGEGDYHPDANGAYADYDDEVLDLRGTVISDEMGSYSVKTLVPGAYFPRPRHFHYRITAAGHERLVTQLYISNDDAAGRPDDDCRHAPIETTDDGLLYAAPDVFLTGLE